MHSSGEFLEPDRGLFLIRFRSRDLRVGSRFGRCLLGVGAIYPARSRRELEFFIFLVSLVLFLTGSSCFLGTI
jgi:hypothetical protein